MLAKFFGKVYYIDIRNWKRFQKEAFRGGSNSEDVSH